MENIIRQIILMFEHSNQSVVNVIGIRCLGNIMKNDYQFVEMIVNSNLIPTLSNYDNVFIIVLLYG